MNKTTANSKTATGKANSKTANSKTANSKTANSKTANSKTANSKTANSKTAARVAIDFTALEAVIKNSGLSYEKVRDCGIRIKHAKKTQCELWAGKYVVRCYIHSASALYSTVSALFTDSAVLTGTYDRSASLTLAQIQQYFKSLPEPTADKSTEKPAEKSTNSKPKNSKKPNSKSTKKSA